MTERANVRKVSADATTFFTGIISIGMLLRVVLVGVYGVPYLYNRTTQPIAGFINLELRCARFQQ